MKTQFLDVRNCRELLPRAAGLSLVHHLDECLQQIDDYQGPLQGAVRRLIKHNEKTSNRRRGSQRFIDSTFDIAQAVDVVQQRVDTRLAPIPPNGPAKLHTILAFEDGKLWKTIVPLQFLLKGWGDARRGHQCYVHTIAQNRSRLQGLPGWHGQSLSDEDEYYYVGITSRNWLHRLGEHIGEMRRGSRKRFHAAWRDSLGMEDVQFVSSLMDINLSFDDAMQWEEIHVERFAYGPNGLNMIPGGFKGLRYLHELGIIGRQDISLDERESAIGEYLRQNPRKGIPNPFLAELWKDDDYYLRVIEARPKTLSADQVRRIRQLAEGGAPIEEIADEVGALNEIQVKNVIAGRTYRRVH